MKKMTLLSEGFGELNLTDLNMDTCNSLNHEEALEIIIKIDTLTSLNLTSWKMGSLPEGFGKLTNLKVLNMERCYYLQTLPEGIMQTLILN